MNCAALEVLLARLYTDDKLRRAFIEQPERVAREAGLDEATARQIANIDFEGLTLATDGFARKRAAHAEKHMSKHRQSGLLSRLSTWLRL